MQLPGGVELGGGRRRDFAFRPVDGVLEAALAEAAAERSVPAAVTSTLATALATVGGGPADRETVRRLSVGDRQFLMRALNVHLGDGQVWLTAACHRCDERFDFEVQQADLPVKEAGGSYPFATAGTLRMRVPTGADQEAIAGLPDREAAAALFDLCRLEGVAADDADVMAAEAAVEQASPEVALSVIAECPACAAPNEVAIDPYLGLGLSSRAEQLFEEVHRLASSYHWSEREILALPRDRRLMYLRLIDRSRGWTE